MKYGLRAGLKTTQRNPFFLNGGGLVFSLLLFAFLWSIKLSRFRSKSGMTAME